MFSGRFSVLFLFILHSGCSCVNNEPGPLEADEPDDNDYQLSTIRLPDGFKISVFAEVSNARSLAKSPSGVVFVGNRGGENVYALKDTDKNGKADKKWIIGTDLDTPNGVAFKDGDLYVAEINRILKFSDIEEHLDDPPDFEVVFDGYPADRHHGWKYIAFGPDEKLYVPVGAPCNICEPENEIYASITRINPDGTGLAIIARGVRNSVGFTWHPVTGDLWFTDNGRDMLGDDKPPCELNHLSEEGMHFGYPYCHGDIIADPEYGDQFPCSEFEHPAQNLGPHVAPLGVKFYTGDNFPAEYKNKIFIAEHGSWNRSKKIGYRVTMVELDGDQGISYTPFADGWLNEEIDSAWGRPVDILILDDGSMLVSDDHANVVYRIWYEG